MTKILTPTGVLNVYKEAGFTSHDVVAIVRRAAKTKKVGHTGTLDPDATGVLPVCLGRATKLADQLASKDKTYVAEIILGLETTTGDISGEIVKKRGVSYDTAAIEKVVNSFATRGAYLQVPPMYSAIKIGGKKLYELARKGEIIDRPARSVTIHHIQVTNFEPQANAFTIEVTCSKGTYIRSLAVDIGEALGCGATMGKLVRTQSGIFSIKTAVKLDDIKKAAEDEKLTDLIMPVDKLLPYPKKTISGEILVWAKNGNPVPISAAKGEKFWLCDGDELIGLYASDGEKLRPEVML